MRGGVPVRNTKLSMNALVLLVIVFSAIIFFVTIKLVDLAYHPAKNENYMIEDTGLFVRYSSLKPSGIYRGDPVTGELVLEGRFGYDWGAAVVGDRLYINEYRTTSMGLMLCDLVRVDLETFGKETVLRDTVLQGICASGELVCIGKTVMPASYPKTNALSRLYAMTARTGDPAESSSLVLFIDPETAEVLYSLQDDEALTGDMEAKYLTHTLEEVRG